VDIARLQIGNPSSEVKERYRRAQQYLLQEERNQALEELKKIIELAPQFVEAHYDLMELRQSLAKEMLAQYESYIRSRPDSPLPHYLLGKAYLIVGQPEPGEAALKKALELDPNFGWALLEIGAVAQRRGDTVAAANAWEKARRSTNSSSALRLHLAKGLLSIKKYESALAEAESILKSEPDHFATYTIKWKAKMNLTNRTETAVDEVLHDIKHLETTHSKDLFALYTVMQGYSILVDQEGVKRTREAILAINPKFFDYEDYPELQTITASKRVLVFKGLLAKRYFEIRKLIYAQDQLVALSQLEKEIEDPEVVFYVINPVKFRCYVRLGDWENAERLLTELEKGGMEPYRLADLRIVLAQSYIERKANLDQAQVELEKAIKPIRERIAFFAGKEGVENAVKYSKFSLSKALHVQSRLLISKNSLEQAAESLVESVSLNEQEDNSFDLGLLYSRLRRQDKALEMLVKAYAFQSSRQSEVKSALEQIYGEREKTKPLVTLLAEAVAQRQAQRNEAEELSGEISRPLAKPAPDFELATLVGQKRRLSTLRGRVVLLNFWATWCGPCVGEWPHLQKIHATYKEKGLELVQVNVDLETYRVPLFLKKNQTSGEVLFNDGQANQAYKVQGIPLTLIIDREGRVRYRKEGFETSMEQQMAEVIERLLGES
jgi:tetratricopeptide (TPR) repeat protein